MGEVAGFAVDLVEGDVGEVEGGMGAVVVGVVVVGFVVGERAGLDDVEGDGVGEFGFPGGGGAGVA